MINPYYPREIFWSSFNAFSCSLSFPETRRGVDFFRPNPTCSIEFPFISVNTPPASLTRSQPAPKSMVLEGDGLANTLIAPDAR